MGVNHLTDPENEMPEVGGGQRVILPESFYPVRVEVQDWGVTDLSETEVVDGVMDPGGQAIPKGGTPYAQLELTVTDGPFEGCSFITRYFLTPGKGRFLMYHAHSCRAITGKPFDVAVLPQYNIDIPDSASVEETQALVRQGYYNCDPQQRKELMLKLARVEHWDNRPAIARVSIEEFQRDDPMTGRQYTGYSNRVSGFYAIDDPKKGVSWVKQTCFKAQERAFEEMQETTA